MFTIVFGLFDGHYTFVSVGGVLNSKANVIMVIATAQLAYGHNF